ncbi:MAG: alpha-amylase family glycosyl hydrolase [Bacteroidota bacterium]
MHGSHVRSISWHVLIVLVVILLFTPQHVLAQVDSIDVTFIYKPAGKPSVVFVPGEFNNWGPNVNGSITSGAPSQMSFDSAAGIWSKRVRLRVRGHVGGQLPDGYMYKFNENGTPSGWRTDPMNWRIERNTGYGNSYIIVTNPTVFYLQPLPGTVLHDVRPLISAYLFHSPDTQIDLDSTLIFIDGQAISSARGFYDTLSHRLEFRPVQPLRNGEHKILIRAMNTNAKIGIDTTWIVVQAGFIQILSQPNPHATFPQKTVAGKIGDTTLVQATLHHIVRSSGFEDSVLVPVSRGMFSASVTLREGLNEFVVSVDSYGVYKYSDTLSMTLVVDHSPKPRVTMSVVGSQITLSSLGTTDPDSDVVSYQWRSSDQVNPTPLNIDATQQEISLPVPSVPGDYFGNLTVRDANGHIGIAGWMFRVSPDGTVEIGTEKTNPLWVRDGIIYEIFLPAFTPQGTLRAAMAKLPYIKDLGATIIWLMPIFDNGRPIDQLGAGYSITDFYAIAPQFGTMSDYLAFVDSAHALGLKVILDDTPNHVSDRHPWVDDIRRFGDYSIYRNFIEDRILGDSRGMGQSLVMYNGDTLYARYSDWSLANLNLSDPECRTYMIDMFKYWLLDGRSDGYRMDTYWGPVNRYGTPAFWGPFRDEIKRVKPGVFILGETDGTGIGSEWNYADSGGACDAAYDWNLYHAFKAIASGGSSITEFNDRVRNYGYSPGPNSFFLRFLENHDEDRIASLYSISVTKALAATLFTIPGVPMLYAGQEIGWKGKRNLIDFGNPYASSLFHFYRRLAHLRRTFPALRSNVLQLISTNQGRVYAYARPWLDQNIIVAVNFSASNLNVTLQNLQSVVQLSNALDSSRTYYLNDLLNDTSYAVTGSQLRSFDLRLPSWGTAVMALSDTAYHFPLTSSHDVRHPLLPEKVALCQNYPNPFLARGANSETTVAFELPPLAANSRTSIKVYDILGREIAVLLDAHVSAGRHAIVWNGRDIHGREVPSGVYLYRLTNGDVTLTKKMLLVR